MKRLGINIKTIIDYLKNNVSKNKNKVIFKDVNNEITYGNFDYDTDIIATSILNINVQYNKPIVIFIDRSIDCLKAMFGILKSGNFYCVLDEKSPLNRIKTILEKLNPSLILSNNNNIEQLKQYNFDVQILNIDEIKCEINHELLIKTKGNFVDVNPAYVLFTSGSTGVPKGTVVSHKSLISYVKWFISAFEINKDTIFGNQTPFYFSMSVSDIFSTVIAGSTFCLIPKSYFSFPIKLIEFLNNNKVNTIYWVPSAISIVANFKTFEYIKPQYLKKVLFAGEVMPMTQLNIWIDSLPDVLYANLFGPTETTDICTYYIVNRKFSNIETLPIGKNCENCEILLLNEDLELCGNNEIGEIYVKGTIVSDGYYNDLTKSNEVFVQNPLNKNYREIVYKTGDLAKYNSYGELVYCGRKDFQIKHMGYRIELGEIETNINSINGIIACACIYVDKSIVLFFESEKLLENDIVEFADKNLINYMRPNKIIKLNKIPYNKNGKIDRIYLREYYNEMGK